MQRGLKPTHLFGVQPKIQLHCRTKSKMSNLESKAPTQRFSSKVENYIKYRPSYPVESIIKLATEFRLNQTEHSKITVADIGCGTGIFTQLLASHLPPLIGDCVILGVEPNKEMRNAAESLASSTGNSYQCVDGSAEQTNLEDHSVDLITCAQAFHWFDKEKTRKEFKRILRNPDCLVAIIWNSRKLSSSFGNEYDSVLKKYCGEYEEVKQSNVDDNALAQFYGSNNFKRFQFENFQMFDLASLKGRFSSSSYSPDPTSQPEVYIQSMEALTALFEKYQIDGHVKFEYDTELILATLH